MREIAIFIKQMKGVDDILCNDFINKSLTF